MTLHPMRKPALACSLGTLTLLLAACGGGAGNEPDATATATDTGARARILAVQQGDNPEAVLTPLLATASSMERGDLSAAAAIDHDENTRWSSAASDDQFLVLDFGKSQLITHVRIEWERAHANAYLLQVSDDSSNWTTIKSVDGSAGGTEDWTGLNGTGRYLRMKGVSRSTQYGYSIFEIQAFSGTPVVVTPPPTDPTTPTPPIDTSKPGLPVKPLAATSSAVENQGLAAPYAIDGNASTRWASASEDGAWIQFDFGAKTQLGYMKLVWENAYGKAYSLNVSDDGKAWTQLRYVSSGKGGTEEFFNLGANTRYVRLQGVARATQYGYSLFEVSFKTPGSDNTMPVLATSAEPVPSNGNALVPLPSVAEPLEVLQYKLADGSLVTRFGARGLARHGRERGEEWNEIGYGPNETVDPMTGLPVDKGPGNYLTFVPQYFQNRSWGLEIIDNSRVPGVTSPTLTVNEYNQVDFLVGGIAFFRAFDRPGVTGYGWMAPGEVVGNPSICPPVPYPANGQPGKPVCTLLVKGYPGHDAIGPDGFSIGNDANGRPKVVNGRPLVVGDNIEIAPSMFTTVQAMAAKGDNGGIRYYSGEWIYVVGQGLAPWYGVQPRLNSVALPPETLSGGAGSVSYNYLDNGSFMFQQPANNVGMQNMQRFVEGRRLVHTNFTTGDHNEPGNDRYQPAVGLQGTRFNQSACIACHVGNGRSPAPNAVNQRLDSMSVRTASVDAGGQQRPDSRYGTAVQMNAVSASGAPQDWGNAVRVSGFVSVRTATLPDGSKVELRKPSLAFDGPVPDAYSLRAAQPLIGTGLLEAVPEADILARARSTPDADGVMGQANFVFDPETGAVRLGRFGWKASKATLRHQAAAALLNDMAVASPVYPRRACNAGPAGCAGTADPGISEADLQSITRYLSLVAVPAQRSLASGFPKGVAPLDEHRVDSLQVAAGFKTFQAMRCTACHAAEMKTGSGHLLAELRSQTIKPYTDLLLHDMGAGLADTYAEGQARGNLWRTAPLWGIGYTDKVMANSARVGYLHDGRARNLSEAILWHGGEADRARQRFEALSAADREAVLAFLRSL